ncbi:MAG: MBL fold metallo-hydrolase [Faecousia sp.]
MKDIDFSCKHDIWIQDENGSIQPMDEPYFRSETIAPGTWLIRSDGDFSYLIEGEKEALVIDSGYGCGNIRAYCQSLTEKPVFRIANTHDHFDHTANNHYFDCAYMSAASYPLATRPFPSFSGIHFPKDYQYELIGDHFLFDLGNRTLETFEIPDHAVGSLAFLDQKNRILFSGDEFMIMGKTINGTVEHWVKCLDKLMLRRREFDTLYGGCGKIDASILDKTYAACKRILAGEQGEPFHPRMHSSPPLADPDGLGRTIIRRYLPHPGDMPNITADTAYLRRIFHEGYPVTYDIRKIFG